MGKTNVGAYNIGISPSLIYVPHLHAYQSMTNCLLIGSFPAQSNLAMPPCEKEHVPVYVCMYSPCRVNSKL